MCESFQQETQCTQPTIRLTGQGVFGVQAPNYFQYNDLDNEKDTNKVENDLVGYQY